MININNFKYLDEFRNKLVTSFPRIKYIYYEDFIKLLAEALEQDFEINVCKRQIYTYIKSLCRRLTENDKPLSPSISIADARDMINVTKTLIANNKHYTSMDDLLADAIDYFDNGKINHFHGFKIRVRTRSFNISIFPEKKEPAFVAVCTGRANGKSYSQMEMMRDLCGNDVYLKCCRPIDLKKGASEAGLYYCPADVECIKESLNSFYGVKEEEREEMILMTKEIAEAIRDGRNDYIFSIKKVIFNDPATVVYWENGEKTVVKCQNGETFDPEKGLAMAISKRALGDCHEYYETFKKYVGKYYKQEMKKSSEKITNMILNCAPYEAVEKAVAESKEIIDKKPKKEKK